MISNLDPASELFLSNVNRIQQRVAEASRQISSGKRISQPSDAPDQIDALLQLRANRQQNSQIRSNLGLALTETQSADGALGAAIRLMGRGRVLAAQGANSVLDANGRRSLAQEVDSLLSQMIACSSTAVQGRYIFSGDHDDSPAFEADPDPASATGVTPLLSTAATRRIEDPAGGSFAASQSGQEIFDVRDPTDGSPAADNVFASLSSLKTALLNNDPSAVAAASQSMDAASLRLNSAQAFYGTVQNRIQAATTFSEHYEIDLQTQLSQKEDADVISAAIELSQGSTQLQAAFQMRASEPHRSLFEFIG
jgi:flagellar hook-associated protein 3 FlgL